MFGEGISREGSLLDVAVEHDIVRKSGAWYTYEDDQLGQGRENAKRFLRENPEIALQLQAEVLQAVGLGPDAATEAEEGETDDVDAPIDVEVTDKATTTAKSATAEAKKPTAKGSVEKVEKLDDDA
jgi:recombination protein RecA